MGQVSSRFIKKRFEASSHKCFLTSANQRFVAHYELKNWKGEIYFVEYGSEEMKKAVAAKRAKRKYQERTRGIGRTKARRTWKKLGGPRWLRDAKGRWCHNRDYVYPVQPVQPVQQAEDENGDGDETEDQNQYEAEMKEEYGDGYESEDLYSA